MPAQLYFGPDNSNYYLPHVADYANPGIEPDTYEIEQNANVNIHVKVQNHGDADAANTTVELYYMIPTTGFPLSSATLIKHWPDSVVTNVIVPARTDLPPEDGSWTATVTTSFPNLGHFCLRGNMFNDSASLYPSGDPPTDPMSAIHNIQIVAPAAPAPLPKKLYFAFAATNPLKRAVSTRLVATPLDPEKHGENLQRILQIPAVYRAAERGTRFKAIEQLNLNLGIERFVPKFTGAPSRDAGKRMVCQPATFGHVGTLRSAVAKELIASRTEKQDVHSVDVDLLPFESRQTIIEVLPTAGDGTLHAVEIRHETKEDKPHHLGGLVIIYRMRRTFL